MKKALKIVLIVIAALLTIVLAYVAYVFIDYHRQPDKLSLEVTNPQTAQAKTGVSYDIVSYNIGFGAYEADYSFFMDGGTQSWAWSRERLNQNLQHIGDTLAGQHADFYLVEEVDTNATRSYHTDESVVLREKLADMSSVWAINYDSPFLFYPLNQPHGKSVAGIMTFSPFAITDSTRRSLPIENSVMKLVDLDRCYSVSHIAVEGDRELALYCVHLSAYSSDGSIAVEQLKMLVDDMRSEREKGNYVVCGGDFNKDLLVDSSAIFGVSGEEYTWAQAFPTELLSETGMMLVAPYDEENPVPSCRNADAPYNENQFVLTIDGFIVSDNVSVEMAQVIDTGFAYSDHNPVKMTFTLKP
jgi:endonuclease/exonuclease/phosphatase family metal-dependent hydrolase